jgi:hypothetical protein
MYNKYKYHVLLLKSNQEAPISIGPQALSYRDIPVEKSLQLLKDVPFTMRKILWFTHSGAPAGFSLCAVTGVRSFYTL